MINRVPFLFFFFERCLNTAYKKNIHLKWFRIALGVKRSMLKLVGHQRYIATLRDMETGRRRKKGGVIYDPSAGWAVRKLLAYEYIRAYKLLYFGHYKVMLSPSLNYGPLAVCDSCGWMRFGLTQSTALRPWETSKVPPSCHLVRLGVEGA